MLGKQFSILTDHEALIGALKDDTYTKTAQSMATGGSEKSGNWWRKIYQEIQVHGENCIECVEAGKNLNPLAKHDKLENSQRSLNQIKKWNWTLPVRYR